MASTLNATHHSSELRGLTLHHLEWGHRAAPPLVLLHGLSSAAATWRRVAEHLAPSYHVLALDQRGHGDSAWAPALPDSYSSAEYVADLEAWADSLGLDRFVLVGHSMGGHHALAYTARHPERVVCTVVNDIPPAIDLEAARRRDRLPHMEGHDFPSVDAWIELQRAGAPFTPDSMHRLNAEARLRPAEGGVRMKYDPRASAEWAPADLWAEARRITRPILFLRGGRSEWLDAQTLQDMDMQIDPARSITLEKSGHNTFYDMEPEFLHVVSDFVAAHSRD